MGSGPGIDDVTIVIPALNEEEGIGFVVDEVKEQGYQNILVIDGYSKDRTVEVAISRGATVLSQVGTGKSGALATAIKNVQTPYFAVIDADGTYPAEFIKRLLNHAGEYEEVIGARVSGRNFIPRLNRVGNWIITKTYNLLFSNSLSDVLSGLYLLKTDFAKELVIEAQSFDVEVEIASKAAAMGAVTEIPIEYRKRIGSQKLRSFDHGPRIIATLVWMAHYYNPAVLYSLLVSISVVPAIGIMIWVLTQDLAFHVWHGGYALFSVILFLFGTQAASVGLISLIMKRSENRVIRALSQRRQIFDDSLR